DPRVVGVVLASGMVGADTFLPDPDLVAQAKRLVAEGRGEDLLRLPNSSFPSFVSAATYLDTASPPADQKDFFGVNFPEPGVKRLRCPILGFFGTRGDVGGERDLEVLRNGVHKYSQLPASVETVMIRNADHMYAGQEAQVAEVIAKWADIQVTGRA